MEGAAQATILSAGAFRLGNIAGRGGGGGKSGQIGDFRFWVNPPFDRNIVFGGV